MSEENQAIVRCFFDELWNTGNTDVVDDLVDINCDGDFLHPLSPATSPRSAFSINELCHLSVTARLEELAQTHPEVGRGIIERNRNFRELIKRSAAIFRESVPDVGCTIEEMFAERGMVWTQWKLQGTYETYSTSIGNYPIGQPITVTGVNISHIAEGKIKDYRSYNRITNRVLRSPGWCTF